MIKQLQEIMVMCTGLLLTFGLAGQVTITGTVMDGDLNESIIGASIQLEGTVIGTTTDIDGVYSIEASPTDYLIFSYVGYADQRILVGDQTVIDVTMLPEFNILDEVVVMAFGISKAKKALGYAVAEVDTKELELQAESDVARTLQGKIAGVQISASSGSTGNTPSIRIRSSLSVNQENDPLIVINNIRSNASLIDIDPNDIASIQVLKGLNASVLYGSAGRNGVILVTTKSGTTPLGEKSFKATVSQTAYTNEIANLPEYQNLYGVGNNQNTSVGNLGNWGTAFADLDSIPDPYPTGGRVPYRAYENNVQDFFRTGTGSITSLNLASTGERASFNLSAGYAAEDGIIGNNDLKRANIGVGGSFKVSDNFQLTGSMNYMSRKRNSQSGNNIFQVLHFIPRSLDIHNNPFQNPQTGASYYYRNQENPLWTINNTGRFDDVVRLSGAFSSNYNINDNLSLNYRVGFDSDSADEFDHSNKGGLLTGSSFNNQNGFLNLSARRTVEVDQTFVFNANYQITEKIGFDGQLGINSNNRKTVRRESESEGQIVFGFLRPSNFATTTADYDEFTTNLAGAFTQLEFNYDRFLYLTLSGRNDWGSTVEKENQSIFYPGVSISFLPTEVWDFKSNMVNFLKLRAAYATSSGYPDVYSTRSVLGLNPLSFVNASGNLVTIRADQALANPNLKPELHKEVELGVEGQFFNYKVSLEASVFKRISEDQILEASLDPSTGYTETLINAGRIDTKGVEIDLGIDLFESKNLNWNLRNIFTAYESLVQDLPSTEIGLGGNRFAIEGQPLGVVKETYAVRDDEGNLLINPDNGELLISNEIGLEDRIIADPTPDWAITSINTVRYKNIALTAQLEYVHGGESYSAFVEDLLERGVTRDTENREGSFVIPGVYGDVATGLPIFGADGNKISNTIQNNGNRTAFSNYYNARDLLTYDNSAFRLREISLSYTLRRGKMKLPFEEATLSISGRNLFYIAPSYPKYTNIDPELNTNNGNVTIPTTKRFAVGLTATF